MTITTTPGAANADSYASVAEFDAFCTARGVTVPVGDKEAALRRGTAYLDNQYRARWVGIRSTEVQALAWPRVDGVRDPWRRSYTYPLVDVDGFQIPDNAVPVQVKNAAIEAALLSLTGVVLEPRLDRGGQIKSIGKGVGPLRKDVVYMDGAPTVDRYTAIEGLLRGLVTSSPGASSGIVRMVRA